VRWCREAAGLTQEELGARLDWSLSKVVRIENGTVGISRTDAEAAVRACGFGDPEVIAQLVASVRGGRRAGPFDGPYRDAITVGRRDFYEAEHAADKLYCLQFVTFPDLLVQPAYAVATLSDLHDATPERQQAYLDILTRRQALLRPGGTPMTFVIDHEVLARAVRAPIPRTVIEDQLTHILDISCQDNITVKVLPLELRRQRPIADNDLPSQAVISMGIPSSSYILAGHDDAWSLFIPTIGETVVRSHDPDYTSVCAQQQSSQRTNPSGAETTATSRRTDKLLSLR
jgi:transcriptional regulator with XRE-family HTH domain